MNERTVVVFDGDDTLWRSEYLYDAARCRASRVVAATGLSPELWEALQRELDLENVDHYGLSAERFPASSVEAYEELARSAGVDVDPDIAERVRSESRSVFEVPAPLMPHAHAVLAELVDQARLVLLTKGDRAVQEKRIADSGLSEFFERVEIVASKDSQVFGRLLESLDVTPERSWSVGNSLASDINPAVQAGMWAIWIDAPVWEHERRVTEPTSPRVITAQSIVEVPAIVTDARVRIGR